MKVSKGFGEIRLVFDRYISQSLKSRTRKKRTSGNEVKYKISDGGDIGNSSLKQLLAHIETKKDLTTYLTEYTQQVLQDEGLNYSITHNLVTVTNIQDFHIGLKNHDHEEADTLLVLHAIDVAKQDLFTECYVFSPDTDVFLLLIYYCESLPLVTYFRTGRGSDERDINIKQCFEALGARRSTAILGFHVLTGCDQIGRFSGKSKTTWWKSFMKADGEILQALSCLGDSETIPDLLTLENIERFVVNTYGNKKMPKELSTLARLRWFLFSKYQHDATQLPPTMSALKYKIFRSHFICLVLKRSHMAIQNLPPPQNYGWELNGESLDPILTDNLPAPLGLIELSVCGCNGDCSTKRCKCYKNKFVCTDMCKCTSCSNDDVYESSDQELDTDSDISDLEDQEDS